MMGKVLWSAVLSVLLCFISPNARAQFTVLHHFTGLDGDLSQSTPVVKDGFAYGTASWGNLGAGVVWRAATDGSSYNVLHVFDGLDGSTSVTGLVINGTSLFGVAIFGGSSGPGVVFKLSLDGTTFKVLHHFKGPDGRNPQGKLALVTVGAVQYLYGTTPAGGAFDKGVIFRLLPNGKSLDFGLYLDLFTES